MTAQKGAGLILAPDCAILQRKNKPQDRTTNDNRRGVAVS